MRMARRLRRAWKTLRTKSAVDPFDGRKYWEKRYAQGGDSGPGSRGRLAAFKAHVLNTFVEANEIHSVIEHGCGDGGQLALARYTDYVGFDVSPTAIEACRRRFAGDAMKSFRPAHEYRGETAELALSLDVVFHLVEDDVYQEYMRRLFRSATRFVAVYSSNYEDAGATCAEHVRHRQFTTWVNEHARGWTLNRHIPNRYPGTGDDQDRSFCDFYFLGCEHDSC